MNSHPQQPQTSALKNGQEYYIIGVLTVMAFALSIQTKDEQTNSLIELVGTALDQLVEGPDAALRKQWRDAIEGLIFWQYPTTFVSVYPAVASAVSPEWGRSLLRFALEGVFPSSCGSSDSEETEEAPAR